MILSAGEVWVICDFAATETSVPARARARARARATGLTAGRSPSTRVRADPRRAAPRRPRGFEEMI